MKKLALLLFMLPILNACKKEIKAPSEPPLLTVTDVDGNTYKTIKIGEQIWMAENLRTTHYRGGEKEPIENGNQVAYNWTTANTGAYCDYDNNTKNAKFYGHLYNWYAVTNPKEIAPKGWHVPTQLEFEALYTYLANNNTLNSLQISNALREEGTLYWDNNNSATNSSGFTALATGLRNEYGTFSDLKTKAYFWSSVSVNTNAQFAYRGVITSSSFSSNDKDFKSLGLSIRCIKDKN